jgi:pyruvate/2-oxoacid:ferredoxin oxidoreductase beta subunit
MSSEHQIKFSADLTRHIFVARVARTHNKKIKRKFKKEGHYR